ASLHSEAVTVATPTAMAARIVIPGATPTSQKPDTVVLRKKDYAIAATLLAVLAIGVAVLAIVALRRPQGPVAASPTPATTTSAVAQPAPQPTASVPPP